MDYKKLGSRIREERLSMNLTQTQLAEAANISDTFVGAIERGERGLALDTLVSIATTLGVTVDYLLADSIPVNDTNIVAQFRQIIDGQSLERKRMAIGLLRAIFTYLDEESVE